MESRHPPLEAQLVSLADEIAYNCHDIEDGLRSGFFDEIDLSELDIWRNAAQLIRDKHPNVDRDTLRYQCIRALIDMFIRDLVGATEESLSRNNFQSPEEIVNSESTHRDFFTDECRPGRRS